MRTIIDIPEQQLIPLDRLADGEGISRAEAIRRGIALWMREREQKRKKVTLDDAFGICLGTDAFDGLDGLAYQRKIRAEWDDRDRMIEEWREFQKAHPVDWKALKKKLGKNNKKRK